MQKICINKEDNTINQIFDLDDYPEFNPNHYPYCYVIDDESNEITHYGYKYNQELKCFEEIEGYKEFETEVLPSDFDILSKMIDNKDSEILDLKLTMAELSEAKDDEILELKLAIAELVEGGL